MLRLAIGLPANGASTVAWMTSIPDAFTTSTTVLSPAPETANSSLLWPILTPRSSRRGSHEGSQGAMKQRAFRRIGDEAQEQLCCQQRNSGSPGLRNVGLLVRHGKTAGGIETAEQFRQPLVLERLRSLQDRADEHARFFAQAVAPQSRAGDQRVVGLLMSAATNRVESAR
jgi:hypothetical protein